MAKLTATGEARMISEGFVAFGESERSEGRGPRYELGRFSTLEEAVEAVQGEGVQGDPGAVNRFELLIFEGGLAQEKQEKVYDRRWKPSGGYSVGFIDLRDLKEGN